MSKSYDDWNKLEDDEDDELQQDPGAESRRDVILFCIDCAPSMHTLFDDPAYEDAKSSNVFMALDCAMKTAKRRIVIGPRDSVGILLFNTTRKPDPNGSRQGAELHKNVYLYQPIEPVGAPPIQKLAALLEEFRQNDSELENEFPPLKDSRCPMSEVFSSCNWVLREGAPKTASKRIFLITDEDDPHPGNHQLLTSATTTCNDLAQSQIRIEPFFISAPNKPFDPSKFYRQILARSYDEDEEDEELEDGQLSSAMSITRIEDLLEQMRFLERPKRSLFNIPMEITKGLVIGIQGYGLIAEQKKGGYKYFADMGDHFAVAESRTLYIDEESEDVVPKSSVLFGAALGPSADEVQEGDPADDGARTVKAGQRPYYTAEELKSFRTVGLKPGIKILGFKDMTELRFEDNIKHSYFIYPNEAKFSGSRRTFVALLRSLARKQKFALALVVMRSNSIPEFCALVPQLERVDADGSGWADPAGFHLIVFPFADDIREAGVLKAHIAEDEALVEAARKWIEKLKIRNGSEGYPADSYPNPAIAFFNANLQAHAFEEEFDPDSFKNLTDPSYDRIHKKAGEDMVAWKDLLAQDPTATLVSITGTKRKAAESSLDDSELQSRYDAGTLKKLTVEQLKAFLRGKGLALSGNKSELLKRVEEYFDGRG